MDENLDLVISDNIDSELLESLPATSESEPEELPKDEDLTNNDEYTQVYTEVGYVDYSTNFELIHSDLQSLLSVGNCILFVCLLNFLIPMIKRIIHNFTFKEDKV